uniref:CDKN1A interacting zinc finger protein 1 n=1 Tax=Caenorhabditis tropicalis TaxID=1561998 RepID=A0A1I7V3C5_9PELO
MEYLQKVRKNQDVRGHNTYRCPFLVSHLKKRKNLKDIVLALEQKLMIEVPPTGLAPPPLAPPLWALHRAMEQAPPPRQAPPPPRQAQGQLLVRAPPPQLRAAPILKAIEPAPPTIRHFSVPTPVIRQQAPAAVPGQMVLRQATPLAGQAPPPPRQAPPQSPSGQLMLPVRIKEQVPSSGSQRRKQAQPTRQPESPEQAPPSSGQAPPPAAPIALEWIQQEGVQARPAPGQTPPLSGQAPPPKLQAPPISGQAPAPLSLEWMQLLQARAKQALLTSGQAPPTSGQAPPISGRAPPTCGQAPPSGGQATPISGQAPPPVPIPLAFLQSLKAQAKQAPPTSGQAPPTSGQAPVISGRAPSTPGQAPPPAPFWLEWMQLMQAQAKQALLTSGQAPPTTSHAPPTSGQAPPTSGHASSTGQAPAPLSLAWMQQLLLQAQAKQAPPISGQAPPSREQAPPTPGQAPPPAPISLEWMQQLQAQVKQALPTSGQAKQVPPTSGQVPPTSSQAPPSRGQAPSMASIPVEWMQQQILKAQAEQALLTSCQAPPITPLPLSMLENALMQAQAKQAPPTSGQATPISGQAPPTSGQAPPSRERGSSQRARKQQARPAQRQAPPPVQAPPPGQQAPPPELVAKPMKLVAVYTRPAPGQAPPPVQAPPPKLAPPQVQAPPLELPPRPMQRVLPEARPAPEQAPPLVRAPHLEQAPPPGLVLPPEEAIGEDEPNIVNIFVEGREPFKFDLACIFRMPPGPFPVAQLRVLATRHLYRLYRQQAPPPRRARAGQLTEAHVYSLLYQVFEKTPIEDLPEGPVRNMAVYMKAQMEREWRPQQLAIEAPPPAQGPPTSKALPPPKPRIPDSSRAQAPMELDPPLLDPRSTSRAPPTSQAPPSPKEPEYRLKVAKSALQLVQSTTCNAGSSKAFVDFIRRQRVLLLLQLTREDLEEMEKMDLNREISELEAMDAWKMVFGIPRNVPFDGTLKQLYGEYQIPEFPKRKEGPQSDIWNAQHMGYRTLEELLASILPFWESRMPKAIKAPPTTQAPPPSLPAPPPPGQEEQLFRILKTACRLIDLTVDEPGISVEFAGEMDVRRRLFQSQADYLKEKLGIERNPVIRASRIEMIHAWRFLFRLDKEEPFRGSRWQLRDGLAIPKGVPIEESSNWDPKKTGFPSYEDLLAAHLMDREGDCRILLQDPDMKIHYPMNSYSNKATPTKILNSIRNTRGPRFPPDGIFQKSSLQVLAMAAAFEESRRQRRARRRWRNSLKADRRLRRERIRKVEEEKRKAAEERRKSRTEQKRGDREDADDQKPVDGYEELSNRPLDKESEALDLIENFLESSIRQLWILSTVSYLDRYRSLKITVILGDKMEKSEMEKIKEEIKELEKEAAQFEALKLLVEGQEEILSEEFEKLEDTRWSNHVLKKQIEHAINK